MLQLVVQPNSFCSEYMCVMKVTNILLDTEPYI